MPVKAIKKTRKSAVFDDLNEVPAEVAKVWIDSLETEGKVVIQPKSSDQCDDCDISWKCPIYSYVESGTSIVSMCKYRVPHKASKKYKGSRKGSRGSSEED